MRVFMLGWEFPPFVSGGLGTACHGLTRSLVRQNVEVVFVLPKAVTGPIDTHVRLLPRVPAGAALREWPATPEQDTPTAAQPKRTTVGRSLERIEFRQVPSAIRSPYPHRDSAAGSVLEQFAQWLPLNVRMNLTAEVISAAAAHASPRFAPGQNPMYSGDLIEESRRYARLCVALAANERFDVIHAHDWMTFPAGLAVAAATGKPLIVHVHSTEFDRSGGHINQQVYDIERRGMRGAMRVICVSYLTRSTVQRRYGVDPAKIEVVYNGIESHVVRPASSFKRAMIRKNEKIVLFLGRITMQKGPEYFIEAARKVLDKFGAVKFVVAGSGDMVQEIIDRAEQAGIGHKVVFTGFLRGKDVERVFRMADLYVMPSVSEPFGIAPLEAIAHDVPVIISKQSGVAEVLTHALKVDFWDTDDIANKIIAVLKHPPLSTTLREHADIEVRRLTWDDAASRCVGIYQTAIRLMPH